MGQEMVDGIMDILQTMRDAVKYLLKLHETADTQEFEIMCDDVSEGIGVVQEIAGREMEDDACNHLWKACVCATESLKDIRQMALQRSKETAWKLECELRMILENMSLDFYYRKLVYGHPERLEEFRERIKQTGNFYRLDQPAKEREYACDLSIWVIGYNHLDVTKICVENILRNLPEDISFELILFNHGSDDGTKEYFAGIENAHVVNMAINRAIPYVSNPAMRGRYSLYVSNDVFVGKKAIDNMYRALAEHDDYGWIVPTTPNISNFQTIPSNYGNFDDFFAFAEQNNVYDERRHEVRVRLCNPIYMLRTVDYNRCQVELYEQLYGVQNTSSFPDDKVSLWMRRHGYKNILAKDAYCHHVGSVTLKNDYDSEQKWIEYYDAGRKRFLEDFGVDPWGTGGVYSPELFKAWHLPRMEKAAVLGINCGLGSNSLKVRETLKELGGTEILLYNATQEECWLQDLRGVSDMAFLFDGLQDIVEKTGRAIFDFIVLEDLMKGCASKDYPAELDKAGIGYREIAFLDEERNWHIVRGDTGKLKMQECVCGKREKDFGGHFGW